MATPSFRPPPGLRNPHVQTILGSLARKAVQGRRYAEFLAAADLRVVEAGGVRLNAQMNLKPDAPLVILLPGWLGHDGSSYVVTAGDALWRAGYSVVRLNLRDHGGSEDNNEGLFNSSLIDEVVAAVDLLARKQNTGASGLVGFSLGGNFALRVARARPDTHVLAVCPAIDPAETLQAIDANPVYQHYFIRKWRRALEAKAAAFPALYDFTRVAGLSTVAALNDFFVRYHSEWKTAADYFATYDLRGDALSGTYAHILAARDDPIINPGQYANVAASITMDLTDRGGHGAYLNDWALRSWADDYIVAYFDREFRRDQEES